MSRVYIAGPMTGLPNYNYDNFRQAAEVWRNAGWEVVNPADHFDGDQGRPYRDYVAADLVALRTCDAIAMLPGWDGPNARGSVWEREIALMLGMEEFSAAYPVTPRPKKTILEEAQRLVHGNRGSDYGHPADDYARTGRMWGAILGIPDIDPRICTLMMAAMKVSREVNKHKRDNLTDLAGYAECASMIAQRQGAAL